MNKIYTLLFAFIVTTADCQNVISWPLYTGNAATGNSILIGSNQQLGAGMATPIYANNYQKLPVPAGGWPQVIDTASTSAYIDFPFRLPSATNCYDTLGIHYCTGGGSFFLDRIGFSGFVSSLADSVLMDVYFVDSSYYSTTLNSNKRFKYLGSVKVTSIDPLLPTSVLLSVSQFHLSIEDGRNFSAFRLYPKTGGELSIHEVRIEGSTSFLLPIHFTRFSYSILDSKVQLQWRVDNTSDITDFVIERSSDGRNFSNIKSLPASQVHEYSFTDEHPLSENFYRIKAVNRNGNMTLSSVVRAFAKKHQLMSVFPNPVVGSDLTVVTRNFSYGNYIVSIVNAVGIKLYSTSITTSTGLLMVKVPASIPNGKYFMEIEGEGYKSSSSLLISR